MALITRVVIATGLGGTSFLGFYSYLYSSGAYPARLEQLLEYQLGVFSQLTPWVTKKKIKKTTSVKISSVE